MLIMCLKSLQNLNIAMIWLLLLVKVIDLPLAIATNLPLGHFFNSGNSTSSPPLEHSLPMCGPTEINYGRWENCSAPYNVTWPREAFDKYFYHGGPGEALEFTQIWLPHNCSYHRWRNSTLQSCAKNVQIHRNNSHQLLRIAFIGDSGTRGVFNGLTRLLSGSEAFGPCINDVCGKPGQVPASYRQTHHIYRVPFPPHVELIFMYFRSIMHANAADAFKEVVNLQPYTIIFNTGAWDFDHLARSLGKKHAPPQCNSSEYEEVSQSRVSPAARKVFQEITNYASTKNVSLLYRTNHYNARYGANCADDKVIAMLQEEQFKSTWDIWENFNVSRDSWVEQTYDGFHFDRNRVHSTEHARGFRKFCLDRNWMIPGQLETTLVQTLLHQLFHDCTKHFHRLHRKAEVEKRQRG